MMTRILFVCHGSTHPNLENAWIYTRKEPFIKRQNLRAVTQNQTFVTKSNSMKKHDLTIVFFSKYYQLVQ